MTALSLISFYISHINNYSSIFGNTPDDRYTYTGYQWIGNQKACRFSDMHYDEQNRLNIKNSQQSFILQAEVERLKCSELLSFRQAMGALFYQFSARKLLDKHQGP